MNKKRFDAMAFYNEIAQAWKKGIFLSPKNGGNAGAADGPAILEKSRSHANGVF
ncbi:MAG: hypothetical protein IKH03_02300 [Oscillospiraceae bacterium]|nr:hypothetical protein [Oscillospiraceae bacterium]